MVKSHLVISNPKGGWDVRVSGGKKTIKHFTTKQPAIDAARTISKNQKTELVICNKDGRIGPKDSHGHDPRIIDG